MTDRELRKQFFATYVGQSYEQDNQYFDYLNGSDLNSLDGISLIVKDISHITDEDALHVSTCSEFVSILRHKIIILKRLENDTLTINQVDLLRFKGYLVPFMHLSIQDLLNRGWAKYE